MQSIRLLRCLSGPFLFRTAAVLLTYPCTAQVLQAQVLRAQVLQAPGTLPGGQHLRFPAPGSQPEIPTPPIAANNQQSQNQQQSNATPTPTVPAPAAVPPSLLDKPPHPARILLTGGQLSVNAENSSLSQILEAVESTSGMTVEGLGKDQRVFGDYGPGDPREVLSSLLDGAGYNFLMVGATDSGAPRQIVLTDRTNAALSMNQGSGASQLEEEEEPVVNNSAEENQRVPSVVSPPPDSQGSPARTPAEILQELQRMRSQQQQQAPQQQQQPPQ